MDSENMFTRMHEISVHCPIVNAIVNIYFFSRAPGAQWQVVTVRATCRVNTRRIAAQEVAPSPPSGRRRAP